MSTDEIPEKPRNDFMLSEIEALLRRADAMPTIDDRTPDEILGYDEHGLPRQRSAHSSSLARLAWVPDILSS